MAIRLRFRLTRPAGGPVVVAGSTAKAVRDHGLAYGEWERQAIRRLRALGLDVVRSGECWAHLRTLL